MEVAASILWLLAGDAGQRSILAWHFGWETARDASGQQWMAPYLAQTLNDDYAAVRYIAWRSLKKLPGFEDFEYDFDGPETFRIEAVGRAIAKWEQQTAANSATDLAASPLLIDFPRKLRRDRIEQLLQRQDQRSTNVIE